MNEEKFVFSCRKLITAYKNKSLGPISSMPEDKHPEFKNSETEDRFAYFTLPMSLNYQRDSFKLWESALRTYLDNETRNVFDVNRSSLINTEKLRKMLIKYKLALQPNKHINTWKTLSTTISSNWGSITDMIKYSQYDFLKLKNIIQKEKKKDFPYLSGPKIFNYWTYILMEYGNVELMNAKYIEIAPDTHVIKGSVLLGVITAEEADKMSRELISEKWRKKLEGTGIMPIQMHAPLWFWSKNNFSYNIDN
jgi:hypothetical protein